MAIDQGPATGNATVVSGNGCGIEVHVGNPVSVITSGAPNGTGIDPFSPSLAPYVDPSQAGANYQGNPVVPISKTIAFGNTGVTVVIANPA